MAQQTLVVKPKNDVPSLAEAREIQALAHPDAWAAQLRLEVESRAFTLKGREYQRAILRDESQTIICPKGAQMGLTTVFLVKSCHAVTKRGWTVLYLLPFKAGTAPFVQGRIDPMIDSSKRLQRLFKRVDNRTQKVTVDGVRWYIRGTNIHSELREVPADVLVLDERDISNSEFLGDAYERLSGSTVQRVYELSTPTIDGHGVYGEDGWRATDQMQWWVACPRCDHKQVLGFEENIIAHLGDTIDECVDACRCQHCGAPFSDLDRAAMNATGEWVPANPGATTRGYHISQLNSPTKKLADPKMGMLVNWFKGQTDAGALKDFYTLGLGLPYSALGDKFTVELLDSARADYGEGTIVAGHLCIGIDQGVDSLHVTVWAKDGIKFRLARAMVITGEVGLSKWQVLERDVLQAYSGWTAVCDAHPDKEDCESIAQRYPGQFWMGYEKDRPDQKETANFDKVVYGEPGAVKIDRTMAFDSYIKSYILGQAKLPREAREMGEHMPNKPYNGFYHQHLQMARVHQADSTRELVARWVNGNMSTKPGAKRQAKKSGNRPDHWMHSSMFAYVAGMGDAPLVIEPEVGQMLALAGGFVTRRR